MAHDCSDPVNHPFVVWSACFMWLMSVITITISLLLFICVGDILVCTGTDLINAFVLLSGIVMLPTNLKLVYLISQNRKISHKVKVGLCPLWLCILLIVIINTVGSALCIRRMWIGKKLIQTRILQSIDNYRTSHHHKRFIDNLQWLLKCCGLNSYKDWFTRDWYDKSRDYEWEPSPVKRQLESMEFTDSVPLSCCKSGSCISNYLAELGTRSVHTKGCSPLINRLIKIYVMVHIAVFIIIIIIELLVLRFTIKASRRRWPPEQLQQCLDEYNVRQIMDIRDNFHPTSQSSLDEESS